jgi:hypothetical protein
MIKGAAFGPDRQLLLLGLSRLNTERLLDDQPIFVRGAEVHPAFAGLEVILFAGEDEDAMATHLRELIGPNTDVVDAR